MPNMNPKKCPMPEQAPDVRNKNFEEVTLGYTAEMAVEEAQRCLNCKNKPCMTGCPVQVKIPEFIALVAEGKFLEAAAKIKETSALPAVCGRVCPQESQCECHCVRGIKGEAGCHRPSGALCCRLCAREQHRKGSKAGVQRPQGCHRWCRPGRSDLCRRSGSYGLRSYRFRGTAHRRRRTHVRHSGVPSAEDYRAEGNRHTEGPRC